ncbi:MAG: class I SAM-dependent methyltransferase [Nevskia sp.]
MPDKPYSPACERNREPILAVLREHFADRQEVLEIGSGTGQHAVHFAAAMPWLRWQAADRAPYLPGIRAWLAEAALPNTPAPLALDVDGLWPAARYDAVFSANTLHIMSWPEVVTLFERLPSVLGEDAKLAIYGPFRYRGAHTSASNAGFDAALRAEVAAMGIRDVEAVLALAAGIGFELREDRAMPANNRCLVWQRAAQNRA